MRNPPPPRDPAVQEVFQVLSGPGGPADIEHRFNVLQKYRTAAPAGAAQVDHMLLEEVTRLHWGLEQARQNQAEVRQMIEELTAPPFFPGVYLGLEDEDPEARAVVSLAGEIRAVRFGDTNPDDFTPGDRIWVSHERNFIHGKSGGGVLNCGETATFLRRTGERLVIKSREEELVVIPAAGLRDAILKEGDLVRFDRQAWAAFEKIEQPQGEAYFLEDAPEETFEAIGGLDHEIASLKRSIELHFYHSETVRRYRLRRKKAVTLYGPPGTGKTMIARALANWMGKLSKSGRSRFINIKPAALHSMWYGQTQANYRNIFRAAREAGAAEPESPVVMFIDEVDAIGGIRGRSYHQIDDSVLNAFMTELQGLEDRGNVLVVAATNRIDALDPGLMRAGRLGDLMIRIPRPNRRAARQIFEKHFPEHVPYANGATRSTLIDAAVSRVFAANGEGEVAHIMFRDGKRRPVRAADLISGAEISAIALAATENACARDARGGEAGIQLPDVMGAVDEFLTNAARALTPANCRNHLDDLPQDVDVVRVDPVTRKVARPFRYLNAA
jgi:proteasome-associated ATPase